LLAASACCAAVKEGAELYKQAKSTFLEVKSTVEEVAGIANEVTTFWQKLFGKKSKAKPLAQATRKKTKYVAIDEHQVMSDIVIQLTNFFKIQEQLIEHLRLEEQKSQTEVDTTHSVMESALQRVLIKDRLAQLETEIREAMIYNTPPEMGAMWSKTLEMRNVIKVEQDKARKKRDEDAWLRKEQERLHKEKVTYLIVTILFLLYLWLLLAALNRIGEV
jgi:membrane-associated HD superfamily phosphohydrolase